MYYIVLTEHMPCHSTSPAVCYCPFSFASSRHTLVLAVRKNPSSIFVYNAISWHDHLHTSDLNMHVHVVSLLDHILTLSFF